MNKLFVLALCLVPSLAMAQGGPILQSGNLTPRHLLMGVANGVAGDAGPALGGPLNINPSELGITAGGTPLCINSGPITSPYYQLCLGADSLGGGLLTYSAKGGANQKPLQFCSNGTCVQFPFTSNSGVTGPSTSTIGDIATWNNTTGTLLADSGVPITGIRAATQTCSNILAFGGVRDGVTDNSAAWAAALAASPVGKPCIYFPVGNYSFAAQVSYTLAANGQVITIQGDGPDTSSLIWPAGGGILINGTAIATAFHVHDLSLLTGTNGTGIGFDAQWGTVHNNNVASSTFDRMRVSGNSVGTNFWFTGIRLNGVSQVNINSIDIYGQGTFDPTIGDALLVEAPGTNASFIYNIVNSNFKGALHGINYGGSVQGFAIANTNFILNHIGIYVGADNGGAQAQLSITNSQFDNQSDNILVDTGSNLSHFMAINNIFFIEPNTSGIHIIGGGDNQIRANNFTAGAPFTLNGGTALIAENAGLNIADGNMCLTMTTCIHLTSTANGWRVSNTWTNDTVGSTTIINDAVANGNTITGLFQSAHGAFPDVLGISAVSGISGPGTSIQVTTVQDTSELVIGQLVLFTAPGVTNQPAIYKIATIPDAHTVVLGGSAFGGSLTSNGALSAIP